MDAFVILDTNIWISTKLLTSGLGPAFLFSLKRTGIKLAIPEVIEREIRKNSRDLILKAIKTIHEGYADIEMVMGIRDDYMVPSQTEIDDRVDERLNELQLSIHKIKFTFDDAKNALLKVINGLPPNGIKNQQFKDSAIWKSIIRLSDLGEIYFITEDKGFFKDREPIMGLADNLADETLKTSHPIKVYSELIQFMNQIEQTLPPLDKNMIEKSIISSLSEVLTRHVQDIGYDRGDLFGSDIFPFITEQPNILVIDFKFSFNAIDIPIPENNSNTDGVLVRFWVHVNMILF